jgi:hypothetical protein
MAATIEICESNGGAETVTHSITNTNMGNTEAVNLDPVAFPVTPGAKTYAKYQRIHVTAMGGSSKIENLKIWRTGALGGAATHETNARIAAYAGAIAYVTPVKIAILTVDQTMPVAVPASANLGIAGSLAGSLLATGYSDYLVHQISTNVADIAGSTSTISFQYDEIA